MDNKDWQHQPLTWSLIKTQFANWFPQHKVALLWALVVAIILWGICRSIAGTGNTPIPGDAQLVQITNYAQAYDVYRRSDSLILSRVRSDGELSILMAGFGVTWWLIYTIREYRSERKQRGFSSAFFVGLNVAFGLYLGFMIYAYAYPSALVLTHPQSIVLDPVHDLVSLNGKPLGHISQIAEFEGIEKSAYRSRWSWFGVKLKDGHYYAFDQGEFVGANVQLIAAYLNDYLRKLPPMDSKPAASGIHP
jgi:hypothetical protein